MGVERTAGKACQACQEAEAIARLTCGDVLAGGCIRPAQTPGITRFSSETGVKPDEELNDTEQHE
jgi:hypothetical protein